MNVTFILSDPNQHTVAVSDADVAMAMAYTTKAIRPISAYASQYGHNRLAVDSTVLTFAPPALASNTFTYDDLHGWVDTIKADNHPPGQSAMRSRK